MNTVRAMDTELLELHNLTDPDRPITYGVVKPGPEDPSTGIVFIRGGDISNGLIDEENLRTITEEVSRPYARTILRGGEVVISLVGNPGQVAVVPGRLAGANLARQAGLIALRPEIDAAYIKYYLMSPPGKAELFQRTQGAVQQVINLSDLKRVKVRLPSRQVQEGIVFVLSAYDDLIENNRRRIALLEEAARLLYREWFVHFRFPGHEHVKITDGMPAGWARRALGDVVEVVKNTVKPSDFMEGDIHIGLGHIPRRSFTLAEWESAEDLSSGKTRFEESDILFCKIRPYFHKVGFTLRSGLTSSDALVWRVKDTEEWPLVVCETSSDHFVAVASKTVREGSKMPRADWKVLRKYSIPKPPVGLLGIFNDTVNPITAQCKALALQNRALIEARDLLLPRLMNGEIAV